jgi:hypothetical protein
MTQFKGSTTWEMPFFSCTFILYTRSHIYLDVHLKGDLLGNLFFIILFIHIYQ